MLRKMVCEAHGIADQSYAERLSPAIFYIGVDPNRMNRLTATLDVKRHESFDPPEVAVAMNGGDLVVEYHCTRARTDDVNMLACHCRAFLLARGLPPSLQDLRASM